MNDTQILDLYPATYMQARRQFLASAQTAVAAMFSQTIPEFQGPAGEQLSLDAAYLGSPDAERVLVMLAGTHGLEGYAASPLLTQVLRQSGQEMDLPDGVGMLLVHGVNPYGFGHMMRTNEQNVDLNRNFMDFSKRLPANSNYREIHSFLCPRDRSPEGAAAAQRALESWIAAHGQSAFFDAVFNGQYEEPEGLIYGGTDRQWSNYALENVAKRFLSHAKHIAFIDWHTGLGEYGKPFFLCFNERGSPEWESCCRWWGRDVVETKGGFNGGSRPQYSGLVFQGMRSFCANAEFSGAVIEFGTTPPEATIENLQLDNRLRFDTEIGVEQRAVLHSQALDSFCPQDPQWRLDVMRMGLEISRQALDGLRT